VLDHDHVQALGRRAPVLIDKTGTLTLGRPHITDMITVDGHTDNALLALAATAERYSEHPLARAVRDAAARRDIKLGEPTDFQALPGHGVRATVDGIDVTVGGLRLVPVATDHPEVVELAAAGKPCSPSLPTPS
jgi:P-type Cu+ transporter